jgi:hypothetical protein
MQKFAQCWLTFYPWPQRCIHPGGEFTGQEFQTLLQNCHIRDVCITEKKNLQSNPLCKRMHQTVGNVLGILLHGEPPQDMPMASAKEYINKAVSIAMHAMRGAIHSTLGSSPRSLTFNKDMLFNIPLMLIGTQSHKDKNI